MRLIKTQKIKFSQSQNNCLHRLVSGKKHHNTTSKNEHTTLLSDLNVPDRFGAQRRAKYSSLQFRAVCITGRKCL